MPSVTGVFRSDLEILSTIQYNPVLNVDNLLRVDSVITETFMSSSGWVCPQGVYNVIVECWGGGGYGGSKSSSSDIALAGGGGGAYVRSSISVSPGTVYSGIIPNLISFDGPDVYFGSSSLVMAKGGSGVGLNGTTPGSGGRASESVGDLKFNGGNGGFGSFATYSGAGGASASSLGEGQSAVGYTPGTGIGGGGNGGSGIFTNGNGIQGTFPGGGGGGARRSTPGVQIGGAGVIGQIKLTYAKPASYIQVSTIANLNIQKAMNMDISANTSPIFADKVLTVDMLGRLDKQGISAIEQRFGVSYLGIVNIAVSGIEQVVIAVVPSTPENTVYILSSDNGFIVPSQETIRIIRQNSDFFR